MLLRLFMDMVYFPCTINIIQQCFIFFKIFSLTSITCFSSLRISLVSDLITLAGSAKSPINKILSQTSLLSYYSLSGTILSSDLLSWFCMTTSKFFHLAFSLGSISVLSFNHKHFVWEPFSFVIHSFSANILSYAHEAYISNFSPNTNLLPSFRSSSLKMTIDISCISSNSNSVKFQWSQDSNFLTFN